MRRWVTGRNVVVTVLAAGVVAGLGWLATWQWERSRPDVVVSGLATVDAVGLFPEADRLVTRDQGRRVSVQGVWRPERSILVADRRNPVDGSTPGFWLVTAVEVDTPAGERLLPVVRGWAGGGGGLTPAQVGGDPPSGSATVEGWIQASEALDVPVDVINAPGTVSLLAAADLVNRWPEDVIDGFVILDATSVRGTAGSRGTADSAQARGGDVAALAGVEVALPGPVEAARADRDWRNVAYAAQWWVFAAFAVVLWWRTLQDSGTAARPRPDRDAGATRRPKGITP